MIILDVRKQHMQGIFIKILGFLLFFISSIESKAQQKTVRGLVMVDFRDMHAEGVLITNQNTKITAITDLSGSFKIQASMGDTLLLQSPFLYDRKFVMKASSFDFDPLVIHMNQEVITLEDMIVKAPLTGDLQKDIKSVKIRDDVEKLYQNLGIDIRTLDIEPKEKRGAVLPKIAGIPIPVSLDVESLLKSITGYYRRMENLEQYEKLEKRIITVKKHLGIKYFENIIGIPENEIYQFLLYVYDFSGGKYESYYAQKDFLSMDQLLRSKASTYLERIKKRDANANVQRELQ